MALTDAQPYKIDDEMGDLCKCTYIDGDTCPVGQMSGTHYPLLNKIECCEVCPVNQTQPITHIANPADKLYPVHYDYSQFIPNTNFADQLNNGTIPKTSPEHIEHFTSLEDIIYTQPVIIDQNNNQNQKCICRTVYDNINYVIVMCLLIMILLGGVIYLKKIYLKK
jgi:hypothetical protein